MAVLQDYWHHWEDVTVGFLLGVLCAFVSYRQHYPGIASQRAGEAFVISKGTYHALLLALCSFSAVTFTWLTLLAAMSPPPSQLQMLFLETGSFHVCVRHCDLIMLIVKQPQVH